MSNAVLAMATHHILLAELVQMAWELNTIHELEMNKNVLIKREWQFDLEDMYVGIKAGLRVGCYLT